MLTLWAAVVARRLGFRKDEALTLGTVVAGLNVQSKGRRVGIFKPTEQKAKEARERKNEEKLHVEILVRAVPAKNTKVGIRAVGGNEAVDPRRVERYLKSKFGDDLDDATDAMEKVAKALQSSEIATKVYSLYEKFRPEIPAGKKGWSAKGDLDLGLIEKLAKEE